MRATAVIGACWGDEGKGLITDFFAAKDAEHTLVIRYNGGAQAGHTAVTPDPERHRHAFSHIGSGTFAGAATYLSSKFIVNPLLWQKECEELRKVMAVIPPVFVDGKAIFTTPWDMLLNQELEKQRHSARHGSCGVGINETVTRSETLPGYVYQASSREWLRDFLVVSRDYSAGRATALMPRLSAKFETSLQDMFESRFWSEHLLTNFMWAMEQFLDEAATVNETPKGFGHLLFEGAQGLLLDEQHKFFPHVTRSRTGLTNVIPYLRQNKIYELDVVYVLRGYMTRHGAGPFPTEDLSISYPDETNAPNDFQGTLRFGHLDMPLIKAAIDKDSSEIPRSILAPPTLAVTCLDQLRSPIITDSLIQQSLLREIHLPIKYRSYGPTRENVEELAL